MPVYLRQPTLSKHGDEYGAERSEGTAAAARRDLDAERGPQAVAGSAWGLIRTYPRSLPALSEDEDRERIEPSLIPAEKPKSGPSGIG